MDALRYGLALAFVVAVPPMLGFWMLVHPLIHFWRRIGPGWTYAIVLTPLVAGMAVVYGQRDWLLAREFGTHIPLASAGALCLAVAVWLRLLLHRHLTNRTLSGLPELAPQRYPQALITDGLYAWVRHPRYSQVSVSFAGWALVSNYLAVYLVCLLWLPAVYVIAVLEERELRERFGAAYVDYCRRVPRFLPRLRRRRRGRPA